MLKPAQIKNFLEEVFTQHADPEDQSMRITELEATIERLQKDQDAAQSGIATYKQKWRSEQNRRVDAEQQLETLRRSIRIPIGQPRPVAFHPHSIQSVPVMPTPPSPITTPIANTPQGSMAAPPLAS